jgi:hypothetical protein
MSTGGAAMKAMMKQVVAVKQGWYHQDAEPAYIEAVVGAGDPIAKPFPDRSAFASLYCGCHFLISAMNVVCMN